jgi:hypothetical protein
MRPGSYGGIAAVPVPLTNGPRRAKMTFGAYFKKRTAMKFRYASVMMLLALASAPLSAQTAPHTPWYRWLGFTLERTEHPWSFGVYGGYDYNTLYQGGAETHRPTETWNRERGFIVGIPVRYRIVPWFALQVEPVFITKNYSSERTGDWAVSGYNKTTNGFLDFPVMVNLSLSLGRSGLSFFANAGAFLGVWLYSHEKGKALTATINIPSFGHPGSSDNVSSESYDTKYEFDDRKDNRLDGGLLIGLGLQCDIQAFSFFTEWRYHYSLTDLQKPYQHYNAPPKMNDTWSVQFGLLCTPGLFSARRR